MIIREPVGHRWQGQTSQSFVSIDRVAPETYYDLGHLHSVGYASINEPDFFKLIDSSLLEPNDIVSRSNGEQETPQQALNGLKITQVPG